MPSKRKLENKIENLEGEGAGEDLKDVKISIGNGPDKWAKKVVIGDWFGGENVEQT